MVVSYVEICQFLTTVMFLACLLFTLNTFPSCTFSEINLPAPLENNESKTLQC